MASWKCPNKVNIPNHKDKILFTDHKPSTQDVAYLKVPKPAYCDICNRHYTRDECVVVA
jgi:hypothetical protein